MNSLMCAQYQVLYVSFNSLHFFLFMEYNKVICTNSNKSIGIESLALM